MIGSRRIWPLAAALTASLAFSSAVSQAEPTPEQEAYWWLDEIRSAAFALSKARTGRVSQWPRLSVPAGSGTFPVPQVSELLADGNGVEPAAWARATSFPVGPIFGPWRDGQLTLQVSACRDEKRLYLRVESPVDLTGLGGIAGAGELFSVGDRDVHGKGKAVELAIPLPKEPVALTFPVEMARRVDGKLPPEMAALGLTKLGASRKDRRNEAVWLDPITVSLVPAGAAVRLTVEQLVQAAAKGKREGAVCCYSWQAPEGRSGRLDGFLYTEPVAATLAAAADIARRAPQPAAPTLLQEIDRLEAEARKTSPQARDAWRSLYCRARQLRAQAHLSLLDAPLLFVKQHPYFAAHIYDDYYTWHPGGGIYILEDPAHPAPKPRVRPVIDPDTRPTLGGGVYRDAELSWDAARLVFAHKAAANAWTSLYEIGTNGKGLHQLTRPEGFHDITPCYLPDGRIVFGSTRPRGRVPCFNSGVHTLHVMNPDGSDWGPVARSLPAAGKLPSDSPRAAGIHSISYNNVTEFDPSILPDGRILYGRWEYLDKTALYMQSLWTLFPDGTNETAYFANNLARPTAVLDARAVPGTGLVVASLTPHNGQAVGAVAMIDVKLGKNNLDGVFNFTPEYPVEMDQGLAVGPCDPWPLSKDDVLIANNAIGAHGIIELLDRAGHRELVHADPEISCYAPMLVKPRPVPPVLATVAADERPGRFLVLNVYDGLPGIPRGTVKRLRVLEETARTSEVPPGGRWWNEAFLISWQGAYVVKNFLGTVPVEPDGSAYFEAPPARALYVEALDADGREVHRMRTFIQAVPGVTRACIGCHEHKFSAPANASQPPLAFLHPPAKIEPEAWGGGFLDYPTMVQPVLDRHCVRCHGGQDDIAGGVDLSGGWTWAFSISYETLLKNNLVGFIRCNNGDVTSSVVLPPLTIGSGAAPLGGLLVSGHKGTIPDLTRPERDLLMAWMDGNSNYYGTWDYTPHATCNAILTTAGPLAGVMQEAGCTKCHAAGHIGNDWVNLQRPEWSRILRAPLAKADGGLGLAWCRDRKAPAPGMDLVTERYLPPDVFRPPKWPRRDPAGTVVTPFESASNPHYQAMLRIVERARAEALATPRVDVPGAKVTCGVCRLQVPMALPDPLPLLKAAVTGDSVVELSWPRTAQTIGLDFELYRDGKADFLPGEKTRLAELPGFRYTDELAPPGERHYALVLVSGEARSAPVRAAITVPPPKPPAPPTGFAATPGPGQVALEWNADKAGHSYNVYRAKGDSADFARLTAEPTPGAAYFDTDVVPGARYAYVVRAVSRRGAESEATAPVAASPLPETKEPIFVASFARDANAALPVGGAVKGSLAGGAKVAEKALDLRGGGHVTFEHRPEFDLGKRLTLELWVCFDQAGTMPVVASCGAWNGSGWFLQRYQGRWRWHVGGVDCDGGKPAVGRWIHVVATFDGHQARVIQDGVQVAAVACSPNPAVWPGPLFVGQYGAGAGPGFQVNGRIAGLELYRRAVPADEAAAAFRAGKP